MCDPHSTSLHTVSIKAHLSTLILFKCFLTRLNWSQMRPKLQKPLNLDRFRQSLTTKKKKKTTNWCEACQTWAFTKIRQTKIRPMLINKILQIRYFRNWTPQSMNSFIHNLILDRSSRIHLSKWSLTLLPQRLRTLHSFRVHFPLQTRKIES